MVIYLIKNDILYKINLWRTLYPSSWLLVLLAWALIKDIRTVIHFHLSTSPSNYLQEIGRAGRDNLQSQAISLYQPDDSYILETLLFSDAITTEDIDAFDIGAFTSSKARNTNHIEPKIFIQRTQNNF